MPGGEDRKLAPKTFRAPRWLVCLMTKPRMLAPQRRKWNPCACYADAPGRPRKLLPSPAWRLSTISSRRPSSIRPVTRGPSAPGSPFWPRGALRVSPPAVLWGAADSCSAGHQDLWLLLRGSPALCHLLTFSPPRRSPGALSHSVSKLASSESSLILSVTGRRS